MKKKALEIGGPSGYFRKQLPVYKYFGSLDGVNFSKQTMWGVINASDDIYNYFYLNKGRQYILDATKLNEIRNESYDFVISSNCLEHIANPIKALKEWVRVLNPGGYILLVLPNKKSNFDHRRPTTKFQHILDDFLRDVSEGDLTHLEEILELHDLNMDLAAGSLENFKNRCLENFKFRAMHHHVFDALLLRELLIYLELTIVCETETESDFIVLARK